RHLPGTRVGAVMCAAPSHDHEVIDSDWRREDRWSGAPVPGSSRNRRFRGEGDRGPRDPGDPRKSRWVGANFLGWDRGVPRKSRWWGADFLGWDGVHGRRRSVGNSELII